MFLIDIGYWTTNTNLYIGNSTCKIFSTPYPLSIARLKCGLSAISKKELTTGL